MPKKWRLRQTLFSRAFMTRPWQLHMQDDLQFRIHLGASREYVTTIPGKWFLQVSTWKEGVRVSQELKDGTESNELEKLHAMDSVLG